MYRHILFINYFYLFLFIFYIFFNLRSISMTVRSWFPSSSVQTDLFQLTRELLQVAVAASCKLFVTD
jgi:hypothetical protein